MTARVLFTGIAISLAAALPAAANSALDKAVAAAVAQDASQPQKVLNFGLIDHSGAWHELYRYGADHKAIVLYMQGNGCPINRKSYPRLKELQETYAPKGVQFFLVNANPHDTRGDVAQEMKDFEVGIPVLMDDNQIIANQLNADRTCEAILIDTSDWSIKYRGAVSDNLDYLGTRQHNVSEFLDNALAAFLEGKPIEIARTEPKGCAILLEPMPDKVSYANDVAPILQQKCVPCHQPGSVAPFAFDSHRRVAGWAPMIKEVVLTKRMPPWHADPHIGTFENDKSLSQDQVRKLVAWVDAGAPRDGEGGDPLRAVKDMEAEKWPLGEPDMVIQLPEEQHIPATGLFDYTYIDIPSGLTEDKWVKAVDVRPTNRAVAHHILVFAFYPKEYEHLQPHVDGGLGGYFAGYLPGQLPQFMPGDSGMWIPAGTTFQFQMHYNATGKPETDQTEMALYFTDEQPDRTLAVRSAHTIDFEIAPGDPESEIDASHFVSRDSILYGMAPHMHYRGKHMKYEVEYPDGNRETLLSIPNYNFDWQLMYRLAEPREVPAGSVIHASGAWDNSARNPWNPDPTQTVRFGDQTVDEMFVGYLLYSYDPTQEPIRRERRREGPRDEGIRTGVPITEETIVGGVWKIDVYRFRFEADGLLVVNDAVNGKWRIEGDRVICDIAGRQPDFQIEGDTLTNGRDHIFPRIE